MVASGTHEEPKGNCHARHHELQFQDLTWPRDHRQAGSLKRDWTTEFVAALALDDIMQDGLISVVLPVFNAAATLAEAAKSILDQTYSKFEIVVVDDGSTDSSPDILSSLAAHDRRIRVIRTANRGVAEALNTGIATAQGDLIARMDADDISEPTRFEKQVAHLAQYKTCVAVGCGVTAIDDNGFPLPKRTHFTSGVRLRDRCKGFRHFPPSPPTIPHPTAMIRSAALKAIGGYRPCFRSAQDRDLWWRLSQLGEIHCIPDRLLRYRRHEAAVSQRYPERSVADSLISDLSAIARHFGLDDSELLDEYSSQRVPSATVQKYARLLGQRYPVQHLASYRAITRGHPSVAGHQNNSSALRYSILQLLRTPFSPKSYRLVSATLSLD